MKTGLSLLAAASLFASPAAGRAAEAGRAAYFEAENGSRYTWLWDQHPSTVIGSVNELGDGWNVISIYYKPAGRGSAGPQRWLGRRLRGGVSGATWLDSRTCPQVVGALQALTTISVPQFKVRGLEPAIPSPTMLALPGFPLPHAPFKARDGMSYTVWTASAIQSDGHSAEVAVSSNSGRLAEWGAAATAALEPCWRSEQPDLN